MLLLFIWRLVPGRNAENDEHRRLIVVFLARGLPRVRNHTLLPIMVLKSSRVATDALMHWSTPNPESVIRYLAAPSLLYPLLGFPIILPLNFNHDWRSGSE
jgi:hypothetical protein